MSPERAEERRFSRLSKFLALVLRHRAHEFDLDLDDEGFVSVESLLSLIHEQDGMDWVEVEDLEKVGTTHVRKRFEVRGDRIRATYGHSFHKPIRFDPVEPPEELYVVMAKSRIGIAYTHGLWPDGRQYVHLTDSREEALRVGRRPNEEPGMVVVRAREAAAAGIGFFKPIEGLFLSEPIPVEYLEGAPEETSEAPRERAARPGPACAPPRSRAMSAAPSGSGSSPAATSDAPPSFGRRPRKKRRR